jgi:hypothetical protein
MNTLLRISAVVLVSWITAIPEAVADDPGGATLLFNGKDFSGWKAFGRATKDGPTTPIEPKESWSVADSVLRCTGKPTGYLATEKDYANYVLKVKWRYPAEIKAGNSGVLLHCQPGDRVWPVCLEAQLRSGRAGDLWLQTAAEVKLTVDPARRDADDKTARHIWRDPKDTPVEKPFGEWNEYEITCRGADIIVVVNGRKVNEGTGCNLTKGRIALQAEGTEIHFKDVTITPIR